MRANSSIVFWLRRITRFQNGDDLGSLAKIQVMSVPGLTGTNISSTLGTWTIPDIFMAVVFSIARRLDGYHLNHSRESYRAHWLLHIGQIFQ